MVGLRSGQKKEAKADAQKATRTYRTTGSLYDSEGDINLITMNMSTMKSCDSLSCRFTICHVDEGSSSSETIEDSHDADMIDGSKDGEQTFKLLIGHVEGEIENI